MFPTKKAPQNYLFCGILFIICLLIQIIQRIHLASVYNNLKMHMRPGASARVSAEADLLSLLHALSRLYQDPAQVAVACLPSVGMSEATEIVSLSAIPTDGRRATAT